MKKYIIVVALTTLSSFNVANAESCILPTPPVCYTTTPVYQGVGAQSDGTVVLGDGQIITSSGNLTSAPTKQIPISCSGKTEGIQYEADMLSYNVCQQVNAISSRGQDQTVSTPPSSTYDISKLPTAVCPWPTQPSVQLAQSVVDTAEFGNGLIIKKYADGTYGAFILSDYYAAPGSEYIFNEAKKYYDFYSRAMDAALGKGNGDYWTLSAAAKIYEQEGDAMSYQLWKAHSGDTSCLNASTVPVSTADSPFQNVRDHKIYWHVRYAYEYSSPELPCKYLGKFTDEERAMCDAFSADSNKDQWDTIDSPSASSTVPLPADAVSNDAVISQRKAALGMPAITTKVKNDTPTIIETQKQKSLKPDPIKNISTSTNSISQLASSTPETPKSSDSRKAPVQKHWYQWLNPFSWFK